MSHHPLWARANRKERKTNKQKEKIKESSPAAEKRVRMRTRHQHHYQNVNQEAGFAIPSVIIHISEIITDVTSVSQNTMLQPH